MSPSLCDSDQQVLVIRRMWMISLSLHRNTLRSYFLVESDARAGFARTEDSGSILVLAL